jgi:nucleoside-diphosphate-sugar epimerase
MLVPYESGALEKEQETHMKGTTSRRAVVVGAGPVGRESARVLAEAGHDVTVVTRSGRPLGLDGVDTVAADAADADTLTELVRGAEALLNCANPRSYTVWEEVWPPLAASLLTTAERTGATLVTAASLYPYGPVHGPMTEGMPDLATDHKGRLRARMWAGAKAAHDAGRIRAVEVRASDYVGAGVGQNGHITRQVPTAVHGRAAWMIGDPDQPHTFTDVTDMARTLAAVAFEESTWGQVWHAVSRGPSTQREALAGALAALGREPVAVHGLPTGLVRAIGLVNPMMRELGQLGYVFSRPYVMDSSRTQAALGLEPSPWDDTLRRTGEGNLPEALAAHA